MPARSDLTQFLNTDTAPNVRTNLNAIVTDVNDVQKAALRGQLLTGETASVASYEQRILSGRLFVQGGDLNISGRVQIAESSCFAPTAAPALPLLSLVNPGDSIAVAPKHQSLIEGDLNLSGGRVLISGRVVVADSSVFQAAPAAPTPLLPTMYAGQTAKIDPNHQSLILSRLNFIGGRALIAGRTLIAATSNF